MNEKKLAELLKYSSSKELYIIRWDNQLKVLFCPFKVIVMCNVGELCKGEIANVEKVKITFELITVFQIKSRYYFYYYFDFVIED